MGIDNKNSDWSATQARLQKMAEERDADLNGVVPRQIEHKGRRSDSTRPVTPRNLRPQPPEVVASSTELDQYTIELGKAMTARLKAEMAAHQAAGGMAVEASHDKVPGDNEV